jgi:hypothetical protein
MLQATEGKGFTGLDILVPDNVVPITPPYPFKTGVSYA